MIKHSRQLQDFSRAITLFLVLGCTIALAQTKQEHVHHMGQSVMPFDLAKTTHIFRMTDSGGVERVIVKDATAKDQVALIQQHLRHEAEAFQRGDYSDPASLHGADMPGLKDLQTDKERPFGGAIDAYETFGRRAESRVFGGSGSSIRAIVRPLRGS